MDVGDFYEGLQPQEYVEHDDTLGPAIITSDEEAICCLQHQIFLVSQFHVNIFPPTLFTFLGWLGVSVGRVVAVQAESGYQVIKICAGTV